MKYLLLIYGDENAEGAMGEEERQAMMRDYGAYTDEIRREGIYLAGDALQPTSSASTVRIREGQRMVTDGPFAETKEQLGGYYLVECENLDEAIDVAARIPGARTGSIEVRPLMELPPDLTEGSP